APIPLRLYCNIRAGAQNAIGSCAIVRMNLHTAGNRLDAECSLAAELPVVIAIGAERLDRETQHFRTADSGELHVRGVFAVPHPKALFQAGICNQPGPNRNEPLEPE